jgi:DNA repair exonuclease SbcCD ATPase subunit
MHIDPFSGRPCGIQPFVNPFPEPDRASAACPVCGKDSVHQHSEKDLEDLRKKVHFLEVKLAIPSENSALLKRCDLAERNYQWAITILSENDPEKLRRIAELEERCEELEATVRAFASTPTDHPASMPEHKPEPHP